MRIAVVGLGFMGSTHARAWMKIPGADLFAVVSRDERKLAGDLEAKGNLSNEMGSLDFSRARKYKSLDDALADPEIDAVDLCTPTDQHAEGAIRALRSGKHALVEKPLALSTEIAEEVAREADRSGRVLMVAQVLRFMPAYVIARERIAQWGSVRSAFFRRRCAAPAWSDWLNNSARSGGGAFDLLIHDADYVRWLFGMPHGIQAAGVVDEKLGIDLVTAQLTYPDTSVTVAGGWHLIGPYPFSMEFTIVCDDGVVELRDGALWEYRTGSSPAAIPLPDADPFQAELAHFHECIRQNCPSEICPVHESVDAVRLMESILRARTESGMLEA